MILKLTMFFSWFTSNISTILGKITALIGFIVFLGWIFDIEILKSVIPGFATMKINTAIGFLLGGISLWLWNKPIKYQPIYMFFGIIVCLIGFLTIIEYSFNVNLGIDELIIRESQNIPATSTPGRMSPNTAICLFLLGLALIARSQKLFHLIQFLALIIFLIALLRLVSYGLGISNLYLLNSFTTMALHTSIAFILISVGILLNDPQKGWMEVVMSSYLGGIIARRLLPIVISIPILTTGLFLFTYRSNIFNIENGFLIRAMMNILVLAMVVWWNARYLNAIDKKHQKSQEQLQQAYENLEICVQQRTLQLKNMNDDLQKSRSKLSNLINTLPGIVFSRSQNLDWSIDNISNGCLAITGYSKAVLIRGSYPSFQDLIVPEDIEKIAHVIEKSLDENLPYEIEYRILTKSGSEKYLWEKGMPTSSCDGEKTPAIEGFIIDITSRKQAEAALRESETKVRELNDQLEQRVQKRTSELIAVNKELESFSYSVSHDLRSPLRAINGFSRILLERYQDTLDSKGEHYLNRICNATVQMSRLIDDILKLSRVTRGELHLTQVNLSQIAQEIIQELTETKPERQVKWLITPNLIVNGDRQLLRIMMENLLNNAWKFTSSEPNAEIELSYLVDNHENDSGLTYFLRDNGVGFDATYDNKLFQPFQRLHTTKEFPGTGIGLATVQRIINRHTGNIWAESVVDKGATFYFTI